MVFSKSYGIDFFFFAYLLCYRTDFTSFRARQKLFCDVDKFFDLKVKLEGVLFLAEAFVFVFKKLGQSRQYHC